MSRELSRKRLKAERKVFKLEDSPWDSHGADLKSPECRQLPLAAAFSAVSREARFCLPSCFTSA
jgi:hypothetical protein